MATTTNLLNIESIANSMYVIRGELSLGKDKNMLEGTGFVVNKNGRFYLVTANHIYDSIIANNQAITISLGGRVTTLSSSNTKLAWVNHSQADISAIELNPPNIVQAKENSIPFDCIYDKEEPVSREKQVFVFGFPLIKEISFDACVFRSYFSTGLISTTRFDIVTPNTKFQYLQDPSMTGYSGGPVFIDVTSTTDDEGSPLTQLVGIVHGTYPKPPETYMAAITPSYYLVELINSMCP